jgi:hypothetical protein
MMMRANLDAPHVLEGEVMGRVSVGVPSRCLPVKQLARQQPRRAPGEKMIVSFQNDTRGERCRHCRGCRNL